MKIEIPMRLIKGASSQKRQWYTKPPGDWILCNEWARKFWVIPPETRRATLILTNEHTPTAHEARIVMPSWTDDPTTIRGVRVSPFNDGICITTLHPLDIQIHRLGSIDRFWFWLELEN